MYGGGGGGEWGLELLEAEALTSLLGTHSEGVSGAPAFSLSVHYPVYHKKGFPPFPVDKPFARQHFFKNPS